jgi:hypothetical protein
MNMATIPGIRIVTRPVTSRRRSPRFLTPAIAAVRGIGVRIAANGNCAWLSSAAVHAALLLVLALIVLPTSHGRILELIVTTGVAVDDEMNLAILDEVAVELSPLETLDDLARPTALPASSTPLPTPLDASVPTEFETPEVRQFDFQQLDAGSLLTELDDLVPRRRTPKKGARNLQEKQLGDLPVPKNANRVGSFTIFAEPSDPVVLQPYWLIIQLDLPTDRKVRKLDPFDVSGLLIGTDGFQLEIPSGPFFRLTVNGYPVQIPKPPLVQDRFVFLDGRARWGIWVPGANQKVRDTIQVRSKLLNERREIQLEF